MSDHVAPKRRRHRGGGRPQAVYTRPRTESAANVGGRANMIRGTLPTERGELPADTPVEPDQTMMVGVSAADVHFVPHTEG